MARIKRVISKQRGNKAVKIEEDEFDTYLCAMQNGFQWSCIGIDSELELLKMIKEVIGEYEQARKDNKAT